jgi:uncharacterized iron-regulated membrane protein
MATLAPPLVLPAKRSRARLWWYVHHWTGLKLSLFMSFILLTGTLAVVSHEIDWLLQPSLRVDPASVGDEVAWAAIAENAAKHPAAAEILSIEAPVARAFAARVVVRHADGRHGFLDAHPATGRIQGVAPWAGAQRILRNMHRHLNMPTKIGVPIVSLLAFPLLVSVATSFIVYKKWWRGFFRPVRWGDARTAWGDVHRLAGAWSLWFVLLIALTGVWYFVESVGLEAPRHPRPDVAGFVGPAPPLAPQLAAARAAFPELRLQRIVYPGEGGAFQFQGDHRAVLVRPRANAVWTDPATAGILLVTDGRALDVHQRISEMADPLHFGTFAGYWSKLPWFLFGLLLTMLSVSGGAIYALRIGRAVAVPGPLARIWHGMGVWRWLSAALIATGLALLPALLTGGGE